MKTEEEIKGKLKQTEDIILSGLFDDIHKFEIYKERYTTLKWILED